ncbi:MAG: iron-containing alcohol dehydrogenase [Actinomycetota bacterium]|nr:iron-containing alcohol dehydrogenase [Actinomycetota bacterium]
MTGGDIHWRDGDRTIRLATGGLSSAPSLLEEAGWNDYELLSTERALAGAPAELSAGAHRVHRVPAGAVNEISAELLGKVDSDSLVAFGGGRVIDTAKAIAAVKDARVAALPTTLSGAEMTAIHKLPDGHTAKARNRPVLVIADPDAMTAQPERERRASAMNALAHAADSLYTPFAHPVSRMAALEAARQIAGGLEGGRSRDLALGSLLAGYAIDTAGFSLHHVICQSLVRVLRIPHAETNAAILPRAIEALLARAPAEMAELAAALATTPSELPARLEALSGGRRTLAEIGADAEMVDEALDAIQARGELGMTPGTPDRDELRRIIEIAW